MAVVSINHIELIDGVPVIRGTHFKVENVVAMYVTGESSVEWIAENFNLTHAQIHAALAYYYDNQELINRLLRENEALAREVGSSIEDVIARIRARNQQNGYPALPFKFLHDQQVRQSPRIERRAFQAIQTIADELGGRAQAGDDVIVAAVDPRMVNDLHRLAVEQAA
jgi:uncharacterized protein (DUF433 family)